MKKNWGAKTTEMQIEMKNKKTAAKSISMLLKKNYEVKTIKEKLKKKIVEEENKIK